MPVETTAFLRHILPVEGLYCAVTIVQSQWRHYFFKSVDQQAQFILREDAKGNEVYHACATFKIGEMDPKSVPVKDKYRGRTHRNVAWLKAFWIDLDCGEGKPYATQLDAYHAVRDYCASSGKPAPTFVSSGYGLHAYWPLVEALVLEKWLPLAGLLKSQMQEHGLKFDTARTADPSSVLRPAGSHNYKRGGKLLVECGELLGPYEIGEIFDERERSSQNNNGRKNGSYGETLATSDKRSLFSNTEDGRPELLSAAANLYGPAPFASDIASGCVQVDRLNTGLNELTEPEWYAIIGLLKHCADGEEYVYGIADQQWHGTIEQKFEQTSSFGPSTCARFEGLGNGHCDGCPFRGRITSPIQVLRYGESDSGQPSGISVDNRSGESTLSPGLFEPSGTSGEPSQYPELEGFTIDAEGVYLNAQEKNGPKPDSRLISRQPLWLNGINVGESYADTYSLSFVWEKTPTERKEIIIDKKTFHSSAGLSELQGMGPTIHDTEAFKKYVRDSSDKWHRENIVTIRYDQCGWKNDLTGFLVGSSLYEVGGNVTKIMPSQGVEYKARTMGPKKGGSLVDWSRAANQLYTDGCEQHAFALLASFAAPLIRLHVESEGGAVISLVSNKSATGKSTLLDAVSSVWGERSSIEMTNRDTEISRAISLGTLGNLPVILEELNFRDPETTRDFIRMFTVGKDKTRATREGNLQQNNFRWQTILIGASNNSLVDRLVTESVDALALRVLEFSADLPPGIGGRGDEIRRGLVRNSGYAGDAFLKALLQPGNVDYIQQALPEWTKQIYQQADLKVEHRFWVRTAASVLAAAVIVRQAGILEFSIPHLRSWLLRTLKEKSGHVQATNPNTVGNALGAFLAEHILDTMTVSGPYIRGRSLDVRNPAKRDLHIRYELDGRRIYIDRECWRKWCLKVGYHREELMNNLIKAGIVLHMGKQMTLGAGTDVPSAQRLCIEVDGRHPEVLGVVETETNREAEKVVDIRGGRR